MTMRTIALFMASAYAPAATSGSTANHLRRRAGIEAASGSRLTGSRSRPARDVVAITPAARLAMSSRARIEPEALRAANVQASATATSRKLAWWLRLANRPVA